MHVLGECVLTLCPEWVRLVDELSYWNIEKGYIGQGPRKIHDSNGVQKFQRWDFIDQDMGKVASRWFKWRNKKDWDMGKVAKMDEG